MKRSLPVLIALLLLFSIVGWSAGYWKGLRAYKKRDDETALHHLRPLAEQGNARVQFVLGEMYYNGEGVLQDYKTALKWYTLAAEQGNAIAQGNLGTMYAEGEGVLPDDKTAAKWYRLAAGQGDIDAQNNLGLMYGLGRGVSKSDVYAYMWLNIAALQGNKKAAGLRDILAKEMGSSQIEKAQDLASDCVEKKYKGCD